MEWRSKKEKKEMDQKQTDNKRSGGREKMKKLLFQMN